MRNLKKFGIFKNVNNFDSLEIKLQLLQFFMKT